MLDADKKTLHELKQHSAIEAEVARFELECGFDKIQYSAEAAWALGVVRWSTAARRVNEILNCSPMFEVDAVEIEHQVVEWVTR